MLYSKLCTNYYLKVKTRPSILPLPRFIELSTINEDEIVRLRFSQLL